MCLNPLGGITKDKRVGPKCQNSGLTIMAIPISH